MIYLKIIFIWTFISKLFIWIPSQNLQKDIKIWMCGTSYFKLNLTKKNLHKISILQKLLLIFFSKKVLTIFLQYNLVVFILHKYVNVIDGYKNATTTNRGLNSRRGIVHYLYYKCARGSHKKIQIVPYHYIKRIHIVYTYIKR